jgi:hypothetical protein
MLLWHQMMNTYFSKEVAEKCQQTNEDYENPAWLKKYLKVQILWFSCNTVGVGSVRHTRVL